MKRFVCIFIFTFLSGIVLFAQTVSKETCMYDNGLYLDRYFCTESDDTLCNPAIRADKSPCLIFVFGGGFFTGERNRDIYIPYYHFMAKHGYQVIAIDYRLGLKPLAEEMKSGKKLSVKPVGMIGLLEKSINMAVEDLYKATAFILNNAEKWNIDEKLIVASGSSAGAITVLQAEYYMCSNTCDTNYMRYLPKGFRYAGIVSFAGAILNLHGKMKWDSIPAPMLLFHGNADSNVPYKRIWTPFGSFNGSARIAHKLTKIKAPHYLYTFDNATHTVATSPMEKNLYTILDFINTFAIEKKQYIINTQAGQTDAPRLKKNIGIRDLIKANFN